MKIEDVRRLLKDYKDIISKPTQETIQFIRRLSCPSCGHGNVSEMVNAKKPFNENSVVPNFLGRCETCGIEFEPYTGIQLTSPKH